MVPVFLGYLFGDKKKLIIASLKVVKELIYTGKIVFYCSNAL